MPIPLKVLPDTQGQAVSKRPLARGTKTALVQERQLRVHAPGEQPWRGQLDDHRDRVNVEKHGDTYVVYRPSIGALSALTEQDYVPFHTFLAARGDHAALVRYYVQMGASERTADARARALAQRLVRDGWDRTELPDAATPPLASAYLTITRWCDLACPYCYQGLNDRRNTEMTLEQLRLTLGRIKDINPKCQINLSGGEPFSHTHIREVLETINEFGFPFVILSNGTYIDDGVAAHLKSLAHFGWIQISLDGASAETHEITRGKGHFPKVMRAIESIIAQRLPFKLAPTMHDGNMHELNAIAELAVANGGWVSPNQLKEFPHAGLNYTNLSMSSDGMFEALRTVNRHLIDKFGLARVVELSQHYARSEPEVCSVTAPNANFICGMAHSLVDIDWNGDVYPCHLSKGEELRIGNVFEEEFDGIFRRVEERGLRVKSHEIEKCSGCKFVSTCGGGCRAGAWFTYGTLEHADDLCDLNYRSYLSKLLVGVSGR